MPRLKLYQKFSLTSSHFKFRPSSFNNTFFNIKSPQYKPTYTTKSQPISLQLDASKFIKSERINILKNVKWDVIVVGGGHAGLEAAAASARMGCKTLLVTEQFQTIGSLYNGSSMGGVGKDILIREIDALDGLMGRLSDSAGIHFRIMNKNHGPASQGHRLQIDGPLYQQETIKVLTNYLNLTLLESTVVGLAFDKSSNQVEGVSLLNGLKLLSKRVILCTGTSLDRKKNLGGKTIKEYIETSEDSLGLTNNLKSLGLSIKQLKFITPPKVIGNSIKFNELTPQSGETTIFPFSFLSNKAPVDQHQSVRFQAFTNDSTKNEFQLYLKVKSESEEQDEITQSKYSKDFLNGKLSFNIWIEPEGLHSNSYFVRGITLPFKLEHQIQILKTVPGFENIELLSPSYEIYYKYLDPSEMNSTLASKRVNGLYFAGQINGTSGYEESAIQGLIAGINAGLQVLGRPPFVPSRNSSFFGVFIDDLINSTVKLPHDVYSCNTEFRILLRSDNADRRLTLKGFQHGCVSSKRFNYFKKDLNSLKGLLATLNGTCFRSSKWSEILEMNVSSGSKIRSAFELLRNNTMSIELLETKGIFPNLSDLYSSQTLRSASIEGIYQSFIKTHAKEWQMLEEFDSKIIPRNFDYQRLEIPDLDYNLLKHKRPLTLGEAKRIVGLSAYSLQKLTSYLCKQTFPQYEFSPSQN